VLRLMSVLALVLLAACASAPRVGQGMPAPMALRLSPASLGRELALDQRLEFTVGGQRQSVDARLESDGQATRLLLHQQGRPLLRLAWDGHALTSERAPAAPDALDPARILDDVQLVYWPAEAIRAALPRGWRLDEPAGARRLSARGQPVASIDYLADGRVRLEQHRLAYVLVIRSQDVAP